MARKLSNDQEIDDYLEEVQKAADHHGEFVNTVVSPLSKAVRARLNLAADEIKVYERLGKIARTCWITIDKKRYVFTYDYDNKKIKLLEGTLRGKTRAVFDNSTPQSFIINVVKSM